MEKPYEKHAIPPQRKVGIQKEENKKNMRNITEKE